MSNLESDLRKMDEFEDLLRKHQAWIQDDGTNDDRQQMAFISSAIQKIRKHLQESSASVGSGQAPLKSASEQNEVLDFTLSDQGQISPELIAQFEASDPRPTLDFHSVRPPVLTPLSAPNDLREEHDETQSKVAVDAAWERRLKANHGPAHGDQPNSVQPSANRGHTATWKTRNVAFQFANDEHSATENYFEKLW